MLILGYLDYAPPPVRLLDVGCGHGRLLQLLARFGFGEYLGVDISAEAIERARALSVPDTRFEVVDMNRWETAERFDAILFNESLYYAERPAPGLRAGDRLALRGRHRDRVDLSSILRKQEDLVGRGVRLHSRPVARSSVTDDATGYTWDVRVMRRVDVLPKRPSTGRDR